MKVCAITAHGTRPEDDFLFLFSKNYFQFLSPTARAFRNRKSSTIDT